MSDIELFQQDFSHVLLPVTDVCFMAFKNSCEGSLSEAFLLRGKIHPETIIKCPP